MSLLSDALDRLKKYNLGPFNIVSNAFGLTGAGGPDTNLEPMLGDIVTAADAAGDFAEQAQQAVSNAQQAAADGAAAMQAIANGVAGALANTVPVSTQGRDLVAATTPAAARTVIGAAAVADVQAVSSDLASKAAADLSNAAALATIHSYTLAL